MNYPNRPSFRERLARTLMGRNGPDDLFKFLIGICVILAIANIFINSVWIYIVESTLMILSIFRLLSRNVYKRQEENLKFLKIINRPKKRITLIKCKIRDRKTHVYKTCPTCKNTLRLPRQKGKHTAVCPCCKTKFDVKI